MMHLALSVYFKFSFFLLFIVFYAVSGHPNVVDLLDVIYTKRTLNLIFEFVDYDLKRHEFIYLFILFILHDNLT